MGGRLIDGAAGLPERCTVVGDAPIGSNMHSKRIKKDMGGLSKAQMGMGRSVGPNQSLKEGQNLPVRGLCEGRKNRGLVPIGEAPDSVRDQTRVQHPSMVNRKGCGG